MKKIFSILLVYLLLSTILFSYMMLAKGSSIDVGVVSTDSYKDGYRYNINGWIYLYIKGDPYERGYQHGYLLAYEIVDMITRWSNVIHNSPVLSKINIDPSSNRYEKISDIWWDFIRSRAKHVFWDRFPEEYKQEINGIVDGVKARNIKFHGRDVDYLDVLASNEMYELMTRIDNPMKGFHPLKNLYGKLKDLVPMSLGSEESFISSFIRAPPAHHCNGFIATGDCTTDGQIVVSQGVLCGGWWFPYYIPQRWNVIIDVDPSEGHRFMMSSAPGYIWSDENYYQNDQGIVLLDTTCIQGLWRDGGYPMAIRTRMAAQYSSSIDDVLKYLIYQNDGIWTAVYLIGDIKTGEIARLDLGLYKYEVWRTFNGFYWSANNAISKAVRAESYSFIKGGILRAISNIFKIKTYYEYMSREYYPAPRDLKFEELGNRFYGEIDVEVLKNTIMHAYPIGNPSATDVKVSNTRMIENMSMWVFFGNIRGHIWDMSSFRKNLAGVVDVPPMGWTLVCGLPDDFDYSIPIRKYDLPYEKYDLIWSYDFSDGYEGRNHWRANLVVDNYTLFAGGENGVVYAFEPRYGEEIWNKRVSDGNKTLWLNAYNERVVVGWENNTQCFDQKTGDQVWVNENAKHVSSKPVFLGDIVFVGDRYGRVYALNLNDGSSIWQNQLNKNNVYLTIDDDTLFSSAGNKVYSIDVDNGNIIWEYQVGNDVVSSPYVSDGRVYFGSLDTKVYSLDAETGECIWSSSTGWGVCSSPVVSDGVVYVGSMDNYMYAFDVEDGDMIWSFVTYGAIRSTPVVYGDYVFFGSDDGWFYAVDKKTGELMWRFSANNTIKDDVYNYVTTSINCEPVVTKMVVIMSSNGMIYGFDPQTYESSDETSEQGNNGLVVPVITWFFVVGSLLLIVVVTILYLFISKKKR